MKRLLALAVLMPLAPLAAQDRAEPEAVCIKAEVVPASRASERLRPGQLALDKATIVTMQQETQPRQ